MSVRYWSSIGLVLVDCWSILSFLKTFFGLVKSFFIFSEAK